MLTTTTATNLFARSNVIVCSFVALVYHTVGGGGGGGAGKRL